jgi:hypothetical protein
MEEIKAKKRIFSKKPEGIGPGKENAAGKCFSAAFSGAFCF